MAVKPEAGLNITANDLVSPTMKKIAETTKSFGRQFKIVGRDISQVGEGFKNFFPQFTFQMGIKGLKSITDNLKNLIVNTADYSDKIAGIANKTGFGTKALQEYSYAAKFSSMTSEDFTNSIENMNKSMGQLRAGGGALVSGLQKVSPVLLEQIKNAKNNEEAFETMIRAIQQSEDPARKVYLATTFFGKAGENMIHLANQGAEGLEKLKEEANKTGNVLGNEFFSEAQNFNDSISRIKENMGGLGKTIASKLIPVITPIITKINEWIMANQELIKGKITEYVEKFSKWISSINFEKVFKGIEKIISGLSSFIGFITSSKVALFGFLAIMNGNLIGSVFSLSSHILTLGKMFLTLSPIKAIFSGLGSAIVKLASTILPILVHGIGLLVGGFITLASTIVSVVGGAFISLSTIIMATPIGWLIAGITAIAVAGFLIYKYWEPIGKFFFNLWEGIKNTFSNAWEWIKDSIASIGDWIQNSTIVKSISSLVNKIGSIFSKKNKLDLETNVNENRNLIVGKNSQNNFSENKNNLKSVSKNNYGSNFSAIPQSKSELIVKFDNMPRGVSVNSVKESNNMDLGVEMGYALHSGII